MIRTILASAAFVAVSGAALAADLPSRVVTPIAPVVVAPAFTWTGFYVGATAGYVFGDNDLTTVGVLANNINNVNIGARLPFAQVENDGFIGGVQAGYNYQIGQIVVGVEADISYTDIDNSFSAIGTGNNPNTFSQQIDYLGTVRVRLGYAFDRFLIFATGGLAYGEVESTVTFLNPAGRLQFSGQESGTRAGFTVGGGLEYAITNNITVKAEYLYFDLGDKKVSVPGIPGVGTGGYVTEFEAQGSIVRAGVNFKF